MSDKETVQTVRTVIDDIPELGPELDEGQLRLVTGGARPRPTPATKTCAEDWCVPDH